MQVSITSNHNRNVGDRQTGDLSHNRRDFIPRNVDRRLINNNVIFKNITIEEAYDDAFGDSIEAYNKKQKRKNRIKYDRKSYFEYLFKAKPSEKRAQRILTSNARGGNAINSFNEEIFQVSDCYNFGNFLRDSQGNLIDKKGNPIKWNKDKKKFYDIDGNEVKDSSSLIPNPNAEVVKEILSVFYMGGRFKIVQDSNRAPSLKRLEDNDAEEPDVIIPSFEERNTNFKVISAIMHNDEWHGTPHIHIDYVAVGEGYEKGSEKQVGFERALKNMGFEDKRTAYTDWREKERIILKQICGYYGFETKSKEEEISRGETYSTTVYRDAVRDGMAEAQAIVEQAESEAQAITMSAAAEAKNVTEQAQKDAEAEIQAAKDKSKQDAENVINRAVDEAESITENARTENEKLKTENSMLRTENKELSAEVNEHLEICSEFASVSSKKKSSLFSKIFKKKLVNEDDYNNVLNTCEIVSRLNENNIASSNCLRLAEKALEMAIKEEKEAEEKRANEDKYINEKANQINKDYKKKLDNEYSIKLREFKKKYGKTYNGMVDYINDITGKSVGEVLPEHFKAKRQDKLRWSVQNINAPQMEKSRLGDEYLI